MSELEPETQKQIDRDERSYERRDLLLVLIFSLIASLFLMRVYLRGLPDDVSWWGLCCFWLAAASSAGLWHLALLLIHSASHWLRPRWRLVIFMLLCCLFNIALLVDSTIYSIYRFHFNGMVWNLLTTPGAGDSFTIGFATISTAIFYISVLAAWIVGGCLGCRNIPRIALMSINRRSAIIIVAALLFLIASEKTLQIIGDINMSRDTARTRETTPFYVHISMKRFLAKTFGIESSQESVTISDSALKYPRKPLTFSTDHKKPNILILFVEGGRFDCLNEQCMPNLTTWGQQHIVAEQHRSGGNASRFGIFAALYGLNATYWHNVLADHRSSILIDELQKLDYRFGIYSSTNLNFPEFRQTAFVNIANDNIHDDFGHNKLKADKKSADGIISLIKSDGPWFGFSFFDASHQPYRYPPEDAVFKAEKNDINYVTLGNRSSFDKNIFNQYKNSLHYIDRQLQRIFDALKETGAEDNTIVVIVGDHGEAFGELGYFGHNSTFSRYQTQTLCVMNIPGLTPRRITKNTSHYDIVPSIFKYMGCQTALKDYSNGLPMTSEQTHPFLVMASWSKAVIYGDKHCVQTGYRHGDVGFALYDDAWKEVSDSDQFMIDHPGIFDFLISSSNQFRR